MVLAGASIYSERISPPPPPSSVPQPAGRALNRNINEGAANGFERSIRFHHAHSVNRGVVHRLVEQCLLQGFSIGGNPRRDAKPSGRARRRRADAALVQLPGILLARSLASRQRQLPFRASAKYRYVDHHDVLGQRLSARRPGIDRVGIQSHQHPGRRARTEARPVARRIIGYQACADRHRQRRDRTARNRAPEFN